MHVREWGPPDGWPLVFWHALGAVQSGAMLTELAPTLTDAGFRVIAPDAPGFGESPPIEPEGYEVRSLVELLRGVLDEREIGQAIVMGHSWGGMVVSAFAAAAPERVWGLALIDSGQRDYQDYPDSPHHMTLEELIEDSGSRVRTPVDEFEAGVQDGLRRPITPELLEAAMAAFREEDGQFVAIMSPEVRAAVLHGIGKSRVTDSWPAIAEARIPILLLLASEPQDTRELNEQSASTFAERFPDAEIHFIEGAGHDLIADAATEVARLVRDWAVAGRT